ncbi:MAG: hypothetical protein ABIJ57_03425 [Pseudomonadota bacterium]
MNDLKFDETTHTYRVDGMIVPSVTGIISEFILIGQFYISTFTGARIPVEAFDKARDFGTAAHRMIALDITGELDEDALDPKLAAVLKNWQQLRGMIRPEIIMSETPLYCSAHGYAGTSDIIFKLRGVLSICDFKTGLYGTAGPQLCAYEVLAREKLKTRARFDKYVLALPRDGSHFKFVKVGGPADWGFFLSRLYQHKYLHGGRS